MLVDEGTDRGGREVVGFALVWCGGMVTGGGCRLTIATYTLPITHLHTQAPFFDPDMRQSILGGAASLFTVVLCSGAVSCFHPYPGA